MLSPASKCQSSFILALTLRNRILDLRRATIKGLDEDPRTQQIGWDTINGAVASAGRALLAAHRSQTQVNVELEMSRLDNRAYGMFIRTFPDPKGRHSRAQVISRVLKVARAAHRRAERESARADREERGKWIEAARADQYAVEAGRGHLERALERFLGCVRRRDRVTYILATGGLVAALTFPLWLPMLLSAGISPLQGGLVALLSAIGALPAALKGRAAAKQRVRVLGEFGVEPPAKGSAVERGLSLLRATSPPESFARAGAYLADGSSSASQRTTARE